MHSFKIILLDQQTILIVSAIVRSVSLETEDFGTLKNKMCRARDCFDSNVSVSTLLSKIVIVLLDYSKCHFQFSLPAKVLSVIELCSYASVLSLTLALVLAIALAYLSASKVLVYTAGNELPLVQSLS